MNYFQRYRALEKIQNFVEYRCIFASLNLMGSTATFPVISSALFNYQQNYLNRLRTDIFFRPYLDEAFLNFSRWDLEFYFYDAADFEYAEDLLSALSFACGNQVKWPFKIIILLDSLGKFQLDIATKVHNLFIFADSWNSCGESLVEKLQDFLNGFFDPMSQRGLICIDLADIHAVIQGTGQHDCDVFTFDLAKTESLWKMARTKLRNNFGIKCLYLYFTVEPSVDLLLLNEACNFLDNIFPEATTVIAIQINPDNRKNDGNRLVIYWLKHKVDTRDDQPSILIDGPVSETTFWAIEELLTIDSVMS